MKVSVNELKPGAIVEYQDRLWTMVKGDHVKPGKGPAYLQAELKCLTDGTKLNQRFNTSETVERVELPEKVSFAVIQADPVVRGQTAAASYKPAILENGVRVMVPPHVETGTRIVVSTADGTYVERAKD